MQWSRNTRATCTSVLHLRELEAGVLEIDDRLAERLALLACTSTRPVERRLHRRDRADADQQPLARQLLHQVDEAAALLAAAGC